MNIDKEIIKAVGDTCGPEILKFAEEIAQQEFGVKRESKEKLIYNVISAGIGGLMMSNKLILKRRVK